MSPRNLRNFSGLQGKFSHFPARTRGDKTLFVGTLALPTVCGNEKCRPQTGRHFLTKISALQKLLFQALQVGDALGHLLDYPAAFIFNEVMLYADLFCFANDVGNIDLAGAQRHVILL